MDRKVFVVSLDSLDGIVSDSADADELRLISIALWVENRDHTSVAIHTNAAS